MYDASNQAMYRSLSQQANPYKDQKKLGLGQPTSQLQAGLTTPPDPNGGIISQEKAGGLTSNIQQTSTAQPAPSQPIQSTQPSTKSYGDPYSYLAGAQQRGGGGNLTGATIGSLAGGIGGSFIPGIGNAVGGMVGSTVGGLLGGAFNRQASTAPTDFSVSDASNAIRGAYQTYLGREPSEQDIQTQLANQGLKPGDRWVGQQGLGAVLSSIQNSPEAKAYQQQLQNPTPQPTAAPVATPVQAPTAGGFKDQLQGFDANKLGDAAHNTPKYVFARLAQNYDVKDPAQRQQLLAALKADPSGYFKNATLGGTNGDKLSVGAGADTAFGGISTFDIIPGAAQGGQGWQWAPVESGSTNPNLMGDSTLPSEFSAGLSSGLRGTLDVNSPTYAKQLIEQMMKQLALGGALR